MPGPRDTSANVIAGDGKLTFQIQAYESSNVYVMTDVMTDPKPFVSVYNETTGKSMKQELVVDGSNQIINPVVVPNLTNNVEYFWEVNTNNSAQASGKAMGTARPLGAPGKAVLGDATYPSGGGVKIPVSIDKQGTSIATYQVGVYNHGTNASTVKYLSATSQGTDATLYTDLGNGHMTIKEADWTSFTATTQSFTLFVQAAPANFLYSEKSGRVYSTLPLPVAPSAFTMTDSNVAGEGLVAAVTVAAPSRLSGANFFIEIDACGNSDADWTNVVSHQIVPNKTDYDINVPAAVGLLQTYKARVSEVLPNGARLYSTYYGTSQTIMNEHIERGTLVATQLTNNGLNPTYPKATFDYFKLSYAGNTSSYGTRYIVSSAIDVSGTDIAGSVDVSGISPAADGSGNHAIPADGNLDLYCYVQHMQLDDAADDNRTFSIAAQGVKGKYSASQIRSGATANATDINPNNPILSNTVIERAPLSKPQDVSGIILYGEDTQLTATWDVHPEQAGINNAAVYFEVSLYYNSQPGNSIATIVTSNYYATFNQLTNAVSYKVGVVAMNGKNNENRSNEKMSSAATPTDAVLPNDTINTIVLSDVAQASGTKVNMICRVTKPNGYRIDSIEVQSVDKYGAATDLPTISPHSALRGFNGDVTSKLIQTISSADYYGLKRYRFRAVSNAVSNANNDHGSIEHTARKSEWEYAEIDLTQKPKITTFTYKQNAATKWAGKTTDIVVKALARGLDIEAATSNVIAIPEINTDINMDIDNIVHALENPVYDEANHEYTYKLTLNYWLLDLDGSGATPNDAVAIALVTNAAGQATKSDPTKLA